MATVVYRPRYSVSDYLQWEGAWELWDGQAVAMAPSPGFRHQETGANLVASLRAQLRGDAACRHCHLAYEVDWHVDEHTVVRPDVLIVCGDRPDSFVDRPPAFVAEILSPATAEKDRTAKRALYQGEGVACYLLIDPVAREANLLLLREDGAYADRPIATEFELHPGCRLRIDPDALW